jgi:uncharacterized repeat protein (TIGR01451 family)
LDDQVLSCWRADASTGAVPKEGIESMGRRLLMVVCIALVASSTGSVARGQDPGPNPVPSDPGPTAPATLPGELLLPADRGGSDADERAPAPVKPVEKAANKSNKNTVANNAESSQDGSGWTEERPKSTVDDKVKQAQATVPPAPTDATLAPGDPANSPGPGLSAAERLPLGKQSVAVTVDVQAPASMNLEREATLKLIVRNTGTSDALNVQIDDELPVGLHYESSLPEMHVTGGGQHLSYRIPTLAAGSDKVFTIKVRPTKTDPFDHAATVRFETGCKSRTRVLEPKLKVDIVANPTVGTVLKGQQVEFKISVQNTGDGPARDVAIQAKLSKGLRHESGPRNEEQMLYELTLPELAQGKTEKLDPLVADAILGGEQQCMVTAASPDVVMNKDEAINTKTIKVVEPQLKIVLEGPESRYTDTIADYKITVENPGTAAARKVRILATLPVSGRLVKTPPEATFESASRRLRWTIDQIDPGAKPMTFPFQIRMGGIGSYEVIADAIGEGTLKAHDRKTTDVLGMPDVDLVVSESKRVLDLGGTTTFQIRLRNYGTKDATNLLVMANFSKNLKFAGKAGSGAQDIKVMYNENENAVTFVQIDKLGPGKELLLWVLVKVIGEDPKLATCRVSVTHDDLTDKFEDMAGVKVTSQRRAAVTPANGP